MSRSSRGAVPHNRLTFGAADVHAVAAVIRSGQWASGRQVLALEAALRRAAGRQHAVCVGSGLGALRLALHALGVGRGDQVIVPAYSCVALANAVLAAGAEPVPVDVLPTEWNLAPGAAAEAMTRRTRALVAVHTFGLPARMRELNALGVPVIEDCAHAFGVRVGGRALGSSGAAAICSFYATKLIAGGEGGAVLADRAKLADFVRRSRNYADQPPSAMRLNDKMTDIEAALVLAQLRRLTAMLRARRTLALRYDEMLRPVSERSGAFRLPDPAARRVWYRYVIGTESVGAERFISELRKRGVIAARPVQDWRPRVGGPRCPVADRAYRHLVSLPLYPTLTGAEQERVCRAVRLAAESLCRGKVNNRVSGR